MSINVEQRMRQLEQDILANATEPSRLKRISTNIELSREAAEEMVNVAKEDADYEESEVEQIRFYRHQFPPFLAKMVFYQNCYDFECICLTLTNGERVAELKRELYNALEFLRTNKQFIQYYFSENTAEDKRLFNGEGTAANLALAATVLACMEYVLLVRKELGEHPTETATEMPTLVLTFNGNLIDLVELGMAIWVSRDFCLDGEPVTQEFIRKGFEKLFGVSLEGWDSKVQDLKKRKKDQLRKLSEIIRKLLNYLGRFPDDRERGRAA